MLPSYRNSSFRRDEILLSICGQHKCSRMAIKMLLIGVRRKSCRDHAASTHDRGLTTARNYYKGWALFLVAQNTQLSRKGRLVHHNVRWDTQNFEVCKYPDIHAGYDGNSPIAGMKAVKEDGEECMMTTAKQLRLNRYRAFTSSNLASQNFPPVQVVEP